MNTLQRRFFRLSCVMLVLMVCIFPAAAQDESEDDGPQPPEAVVYVTTQDFASFRAGPGVNFERYEVIDPVVTLPALGRTSDTRWIQVWHEGRLGWIASILLVWSGDIITLPVDGVNPTPFVRRAAALGITTRETPIYRAQVTPEDQVGVIPAGEAVELTGRLGEAGFFNFQIKYQGQLYWVGAWNIRVVDGNYRRLLDVAYLYPYGRLVRQLERGIALTLGSYSQINGVWQRLNRGDSVVCDPIPERAIQVITQTDAGREDAFVPAVIALDSAIDSVNQAITAFENACGNTDPNFVLTRQDVDAALLMLDNAERSLILASSLLEPLRRRNPLLAADQPTQ